MLLTMNAGNLGPTRCFAAQAGGLRDTVFLLARGADVNWQCPEEEYHLYEGIIHTPIAHAAENGHLAVARRRCWMREQRFKTARPYAGLRREVTRLSLRFCSTGELMCTILRCAMRPEKAISRRCACCWTGEQMCTPTTRRRFGGREAEGTRRSWRCFLSTAPLTWRSSEFFALPFMELLRLLPQIFPAVCSVRACPIYRPGRRRARRAPAWYVACDWLTPRAQCLLALSLSRHTRAVPHQEER